MSSGDEEFNRSGTGEDPKAPKRGRVGRACDTCRRKKIRCDYATNPDNKCTNCAAYNYECTYVEAAKKRGPPKGYVESLESRLQKMETLLQRLCPDADFTQELGVHMDRETWWNERNNTNIRSNPSPGPANNKSAAAATTSPSTATTSSTTSTSTITTTTGKSTRGTAAQQIRRVNSGGGNSAVSDELMSDDDSVLPPLSEGVRQLTVSTMDRRFHGKSSGLVLVRTAIDMKREYTGAADTVSNEPQSSDLFNEWEGKRTPDSMNFEFPPPDLMAELIPLYFFHNNVYLPLLHQPTFERQYREGLHERDSGYACVLLLVCAIASRYSMDPRVLRPDVFENGDIHMSSSRQSAGWKYFDQVQMQRKSLIAPASLLDLQQYALAGIFLQGSAAPYASWVTVGIGLRVAQDVGAHRKRNVPNTVDTELWKRAFWVLVNLDRLSSAALGRPCAIHDEDFDLELPLEVDDIYWEETASPEDRFKQPPDTPSTVAYFNALIKLDQMLSFALRTIYSINKSKMILGFTGENSWAQDTVADLDTSLNNWINTVPKHLRWDLQNSTTEFPVFFQQSAILYATYYYIQILVHRPFIPRPGKPAPLAYPSLAICTNAARSCGQVLDAYRKSCDLGSAPFLMFYAFTSGLVSLLNIWGMMRKQSTTDENNVGMDDVHRCMHFLKAAQNRWHLAGRLSDILCDLASVGEFPLPQPSPGFGGNKRERDADSPKSQSEFVSPDMATTTTTKSRRRTSARPLPSQRPAAAITNADFPMGTVALGNMPLHRPIIMDAQPQASGSGLQHMGAPTPVPNVWFTPELNAQAQTEAAPQPSFGHQQPQFDFNSASHQHLYPMSAPSFVTGFPDHQVGGQGGYVDPNNGIPVHDAANSMTWGPTIDMWSMAPTGFECEDWAHYIAGIAPGRPGDQPGS